MYGSQVWGTTFLKQGQEFDSALQVRHLVFLKRALGVKRTTSNWAVLRECGHLPLQFNWFKSVIKMYNGMLECNSTTVRKVLQADIEIHSRVVKCWTAQLLDGFQGLHRCDDFVQEVWTGTAIKIQDLTDNLRLRLRDMWNTPDLHASGARSSVSVFKDNFEFLLTWTCVLLCGYLTTCHRIILSMSCTMLVALGKVHTLCMWIELYGLKVLRIPFVTNVTCMRMKMRCTFFSSVRLLKFANSGASIQCFSSRLFIFLQPFLASRKYDTARCMQYLNTPMVFECLSQTNYKPPPLSS